MIKVEGQHGQTIQAVECQIGQHGQTIQAVECQMESKDNQDKDTESQIGMSENVANAKYPQESIQVCQPAAYAGNTNSPACDSQLLHNLEESKPSHLTGLATATAKPDLPTSSEQLIKHFHPVTTANSLGERKAAVIAPSDKVYNNTSHPVFPTIAATKDFDNLQHALKNHKDVKKFFVIREVGTEIVENLMYKTQTNTTFVRVCETCIKISRLKDKMIHQKLKATDVLSFSFLPGLQCHEADADIISVKEQIEKVCPKAIVSVQY